MQVLFTGGLHVHYGQVYVESGVASPQADLPGAFAGQVNGLCGAATPGWLFMITGLHTGHVGFTVELHDTVPPIDDSWEEIVEVSFQATGEPVLLVQWAGEASWPLEIEAVDLRTRYCASGMDQARQADTVLAGEPELDRYLLQFWPAPPAPDQVLKQTSAQAAYWHRYAQELPPPPSAEEKTQMAVQAEREQQDRRWAFEVDLMWGGVPPTQRLLGVGGNKFGLVEMDRTLLDAMAEANPRIQRDIARWAARRACDHAGLSSIDWVLPALDALEREEPLPPPFDDERRVWDLLVGEDVQLQAVLATPKDPAPEMWPPAAALPTLFAAVELDPLHAAIDAVFGAAVTFGKDYPLLLRELRDTFPTLGGRSARDPTRRRPAAG